MYLTKDWIKSSIIFISHYDLLNWIGENLILVHFICVKDHKLFTTPRYFMWNGVYSHLVPDIVWLEYNSSLGVIELLKDFTENISDIPEFLKVNTKTEIQNFIKNAKKGNKSKKDNLKEILNNLWKIGKRKIFRYFISELFGNSTIQAMNTLKKINNSFYWKSVFKNLPNIHEMLNNFEQATTNDLVIWLSQSYITISTGEMAKKLNIEENKIWINFKELLANPTIFRENLIYKI